MKKMLRCLLFLVLSLLAQGAAAQATRTWVSGVGDDANPCSRTAPCKTFAGAISKTAASGEINVLDPGGFGAVTITKSITIDGSGGSLAGVLVSVTNGLIISAGSSDTVTLRNLDINGLSGYANPGLSGVKILGAGKVVLQNLRIDGFQTAAVEIVPSSAGTQVVIDDVTVASCSPSGNGVNVTGAAAATVKLSLSKVRVSHCTIGLNVTDNATVSAYDSDFVFNTTGVSVVPSTLASTVTLEGSRVTGNTTGVLVTGANALVRLSNSSVLDNTTGLASSGGAVIQSFNNNRLRGNGTDGAPTTTVYQR